jgi:hypothetical protein
MKYPHLKILFICLLALGFCYTGWTLLFDNPVSPERSPEKAYVISAGEEPPSSPPDANSVRHPYPQSECNGLGAVALYSILLPCIAENNQPRLHTEHANERSPAYPLTSPSP